MSLRFPAFPTRRPRASTHLLSRALSLPPHHHHYNTLTHHTPTLDFDPDAALQHPDSLHYPYTLNKILSSCAETGCLPTGLQLHSHVIKSGFHSNVYVSTSLLDMYAKCAKTSCAHKLFDEMPHRNAVTWNALISGYVKARDSRTSIEWFIKMLREDIPVTPFGVSSAFIACAQLADGELGAQVHGLSLKSGLESNVVVGSSLIDLHAKCRDMVGSAIVFDGLSDKNIVSWTSMIAGYALNQLPHEAMNLINEMSRSGIKANFVTYSSLLSSFRCNDDFIYCKQIHCRVIQEGLASNPYVATTLVIVYSDCACSVSELCKICSSVTKWDQIAWNAVIAGFSNLGVGETSLLCFSQMRQAGIAVDYFTFSSVLKALANISALFEGKQIHALVSKTRHIMNLYVRNGLVSMYAKCGKMDDAKKVFSAMEERDLISWNSLLTGCAQHGYAREVIQMFEEMRAGRVKPNLTTFLAALMACSHVGFLEKGLEYFQMMNTEKSVPPARLEHYACVVDLYGRAGLLHEAEAFIDNMPIEKGASVYKALLSACQVHGNKEIAVRCARKLVELCPDDPAVYVLLANVLATEGSWNDAARVRKLMCDKGVRKKPGFSWV
ncbi:pentatricopeptide repeat-containing protein at1g11290 [Phtheirospermum japonicum]|uniref:Pentatricopeptide repeat-containing protein at1g11290 n=1 Tax=Phtheirospermum japonicum TaxID=374723 RepID=A0A830CY74_9LAMI|nr:pentatricopeptide repeat-containing protein at1g11290 [Phtheirospermum japonicum]